MHAVVYFVQKEFRQVLRDHAMLRIIFMVPIIQLFVFAFAANTDLKNVRVGLYDEDRTAASRRLVEALVQSDVFVRGPVAADPAELAVFLARGRADITLWIRRGFERDLSRGQTATVAVAVDGQNSSLAGRAAGYASTVIRTEVGKMLAEVAPAVVTGELVGVSRFFYNPELESRFYMVPGILVLLITVISALLTGMSVVREKEIGTLEQLLVSPLTPAQIVAGKTIPFALISFFELTFATLLAKLAFRLPIEGSLAVLVLGAMVYLLVTLGVGLLASTVSNTQQQAMFAVWFFLVFGILMSGFFYPIENMPTWAEKLTLINPLRYMMNIVRGVFLKGATFSDLWRDLGVMGLMGIVVFTSAALRFQKRLG